MTPAEHNEMVLLRAQVAQISVQNATLQAENRRLRKMTKNGRVGRLLYRAAADARQLCAWRWSGYSVSRRNATTYGMSRRRWAWAVALLERARVVAPDAPHLDAAFQHDDIADALAEIDRAVNVLAAGGSLASLEMRLPNNGIASRKRSQ